MSYGFDQEWLDKHNAKRAAQRVSHPTRLVDRDREAATSSLGSRLNGSPAAGLGPAGGEAVEGTRSPHQSEDDLQKQVAAFLEWALPEPLRFLHIPNGGKRHPAVAALLKAFGVKKGAADVLILGWRSFIWIELKTATGSLSREQKGWRDWCHLIGAPWFLCRSLDDVIEALQSLQIRLVARAS